MKGLKKIIENKKAVTKASVILLSFLSILIISVGVVSLVIGEEEIEALSSNTHISIGTITPNLVAKNTIYTFTANIKNEYHEGYHPIHEFRIYKHSEFNVDSENWCDPVDDNNWYGPYYAVNTIGEFCYWTAKADHEIDIGESRDFTFSATTPLTDCCRPWLLETRDPYGYYVFLEDKVSRHEQETLSTETNTNICIDAQAPTLNKLFSPEGTYIIKQIDGDTVEWIDTVTEITLKYSDPEPHPSGIKTVEWKNVLATNIPNCQSEEPCWNNSICQNLLNLGDSINVPWVPYVEPFKKAEESCHVLWYKAVDNIGNEITKVNCFFVDKTAPLVNKDNGNAILGTRESAFITDDNLNGDFHWLTTSMPVKFTCTDQGPHPSEGEELCFKVSYDYPQWGDITPSYCGKDLNAMGYCCVSATPEAPYNFYFQEESMHNLEYFCKDAVNKKSEPHTQYYKVDNTAPKITKTMIGTDHLGACPPTQENDKCYVKDSGANGVKVSVVDGGDVCAVDSVSCNYELWWVTAIENCLYDKSYTDGKCLVDYGAFSSTQDIIFTEDSTHRLEIECKDALGNFVEDEEIFLVDSTPPETTKIYGEPQKIEPDCSERCEISCVGSQNPDCIEECTHSSCDIWITSQTPITLTAEDEKVGQVYDSTIYWRNLWFPENDKICYHLENNCHPEYYMQYANNPGTPWNEYLEPFTKPEESCHVIEYYAIDALGNEEEPKWQCVFVDNTPPEGEKIVGDPNIPCVDVECEEFDYWVRDHETTITLDCVDQGPHPVEQEWACFRVSYDVEPWLLTDQYCEVAQGEMTGENPEDYCCVYVGENPYTFTFKEDSLHDLEFYCEDHLGNRELETDYELFKVDSIPPTTTKTYLGPFYEDPTNRWHYIDTESTIELTAEDGGEICHIDGVTTYYRYDIVDDSMCEGNCQPVQWEPTPPAWVEYDVPFGIPEESCHYIEFYSEDALGNIEELKYQCVFVDKKAPVIEKIYEGPQYGEGVYSFQSTFSQEVDSSGEFLDVTLEEDGEWMVWTFDFPVEAFTGEGNLNVGLIIATDGEGEGPAFQIHNNDGADSSHAWGDWLMSPWGPTISDGWNGWHSGDTNTPVTSLDWVEATGNRNTPHGDGVMEIRIKKSELGGSFHWAASPTVGSGFYAPMYDVTMQIPTAFGWATPIVDMAVPNYEYVKVDPKWITSETLVNIEVTDPEPHPSGVAKKEYRVTLLGSNDACEDYEVCQATEGTGDFQPYIEPFQIAEDSCHLIEIYAEDNVEKSSTHKQCVFVDNQPPTPVKEVGEPKTPWDGLDAVFYDLDEFCLTEGNCWKVSMNTPISLECEDPEPHPVDNEYVCFNMELDGYDWTQDYCESLEGDWNAEDEKFEGASSCCLKSTGEFVFKEESEHNLKYYCVDALGNAGPVDDEKFKVEGVSFEIPLYFKWNLISVPFVLLDDSPAEVFKNTLNVESVWSYDGTDWSVFHPDDPGISTLDKIVPGEGYWVLVDDCVDAHSECDRLILGGSLMQPRTLPPSKPLVAGWNLIGYYGTSWELYKHMDDRDFVCGDAFDFPEKYIFGDKVYCSLNSLVDTQEGYPRWSSLWSYVNCGGHNAWWIGLNTCADGGLQQQLDRMYAGRGYWVEMDVEDTYSPATTCIWNEDFECRWTGGGIFP